MKGKSKEINMHGLIGGVPQGSGLPAKVGSRPGTFTLDGSRNSKAKKGKPPLKMN